MAKNSKLKFHNSFNNFGTVTLPKSIYEFLGVNPLCALRGVVI